eukprot:scaffold22574_cov61-Phaeocystis_antarctica.AAC.2
MHSASLRVDAAMARIDARRNQAPTGAAASGLSLPAVVAPVQKLGTPAAVQALPSADPEACTPKRHGDLAKRACQSFCKPADCATFCKRSMARTLGARRPLAGLAHAALHSSRHESTGLPTTGLPTTGR